MSTREEAQEIFEKMCSCRANTFFGKIDESQKGIGFILVYLNENGEVTAGELAKELNVSTARIAALLKKMEKQGLITRYTSKEDARRTIIKITSEGSRNVEQKKEQILKRMEFLLKNVGRKDLEEFLRISKKIKEVMEE